MEPNSCLVLTTKILGTRPSLSQPKAFPLIHSSLRRLWDTETGKCISTYSTKRVPFSVKFHPHNDNVFMVGQSDKKIVQWNISANRTEQEYDRHLGAVNTITFIDDGRRFVSTSDDKSIRVWEFGIPVEIKYIAEPHMHSMPAVALHPNSTC